MIKKILFAALFLVGFLAIFAELELVQSVRGDNATVVVVLFLLLAFQVYSLARMKSGRRDARELGDDDGGIDWREDGGAEPEPPMRGGWVVLANWCEAFEAKGAAARLEAAGVRCRVEIANDNPPDYLNEVPAFPNSKYMKISKMCILVAPSDYDAAKKVLARRSL